MLVKRKKVEIWIISGKRDDAMRIAVSVLGNLAVDNGTTVRAKRIAALLSKENEVTIISRSDSRIDGPGGITVTPSATKLWNLKLIPVIRRHDFDVIYCASDFFGFITYRYFSRKGTKVIIESHGIKSIEFLHGYEQVHGRGIVTRLRFGFFKWLERFVMKRADHIIALSNDIEAFYREFNPNIDLVPVFIDDGIFKPMEGGKTRNPQLAIIGIIGPFERGNVNNHFIDFIRDNLDRFDARIKFKVIGKIEECLKFEHGRVEYTGYLDSVADYAAAINGLDAVIVPSITESYGALNKILEPMAMGKIVYTTPAGYVGLEDIKAGEALFVTEEKQMLDTVNETIFEEALLERVSIAAVKVIAERYSTSVNLEKISRVLSEMTGPRK